MVQSGIRDGNSRISHRHVEANNKYKKQELLFVKIHYRRIKN